VIDAQVMDTTGGKVQLRSGSNVFAVDAQNLADRTKIPGYGEAAKPIPLNIREALRSQGSLLNPFGQGTLRNNMLRSLGILSPEGIVEAGAATGSRITGALGMSRTAGTLGATSRFLSGGIGTFLSIAITPSSAFFGTQYTPMSKALREVFIAYTENDINKFKLARQKLKQEVSRYESGIKSLPEFVESYIFFEVLTVEMNIFNGRGLGSAPLKEEDKATVLMIKELLCAPIDVIASSMKENIGGENWEKFKKFNAAVNAAKQNPEVIATAEIEAKRRAGSYILPGTTAYQGIYSSALSDQARAFAASQLGLKPNQVLGGAKLSSIEQAIATSTYGPRVQNPPTVVGQIGDNIQGGPTNMAIPGNFNTPFDPAAMLK
jgi:hypothetical protein